MINAVVGLGILVTYLALVNGVPAAWNALDRYLWRRIDRRRHEHPIQQRRSHE